MPNRLILFVVYLIGLCKLSIVVASKLTRKGLTTRSVPASYQDVETLFSKTIKESIPDIKRGINKKYSVELRTPGLNDKIEQSAIVSKDLLYEVAKALFPILISDFSSVKFMFASMGDAAGFLSYCNRRNVRIPPSLALTEIGLDRVNSGDDCLVVIGARNNVGDPVLRDIKLITDTYSSAVCILLNCDFSDRVTTGMTDRKIRDDYRNTYQPLFYFRNIVSIIRPSQVPLEKGVLLFTPSSSWELYAVDESVIVGPGSLNRFMKTPAFMKSKSDPTSDNPPNFLLAFTFESMPRRDDIDEKLSAASFKIERLVEQKLKMLNYRSEDDAIRFLCSIASDITNLDASDNGAILGAVEYLFEVRCLRKYRPSESRAFGRLGIVDFNDVADNDSEEEIFDEKNLVWDSDSISLLSSFSGRAWSRLFCSSKTSIMSSALKVTNTDDSELFTILTGSKAGFLGFNPLSNDFLCRFEGRSSFFGLLVDPPTSAHLRPVYIDSRILVLYEKQILNEDRFENNGILSFWRIIS
jgi:hypothetical protein